MYTKVLCLSLTILAVASAKSLRAASASSGYPKLTVQEIKKLNPAHVRAMWKRREIAACDKKVGDQAACIEKGFKWGPVRCVKTIGWKCPKIIRIGEGEDQEEYTLKTMCKKKNTLPIYCKRAYVHYGRKGGEKKAAAPLSAEEIEKLSPREVRLKFKVDEIKKCHNKEDTDKATCESKGYVFGRIHCIRGVTGKWNCPKILTINKREYTLKDLCRNRNVLKQDCDKSVFTPYGPPEGQETEDEKKAHLSQEDQQQMDNKDDEQQRKINEVHACDKKTTSLEECTEKGYHWGPIHCVKTFGYTCPKIIRIGKGPDADEYTLKTMCKKKNVPEIYCRKARFSFGKRKA
eukprot:g5282.t1